MSTAATPQRAGGRGFWRLTLLHARFQFLETIRIPIAAIGNSMFPALLLLFFVVPQRQVADDPGVATTTVAQLALFAVMSTCLFTFGVGIAEDRALPFDQYVRTLPAGPWPRMAGRIVNGAVLAMLGLLPLLLIGWLFTAATLPFGRLMAAAGVILCVALPFLLLGMAIRFSMSAKASMAVAPAVLFSLAFAGGLSPLSPPERFPTWLDAISRGTPSRAGRDLLVEATTGVHGYGYALAVLVGWAAVFAVVCVAAYRNDEGRRFR
jgi:ABC-2 type transport system permease protein